MSFLGSPTPYNGGRARAIAVSTVQAYAAPIIPVSTSATLDAGQLATIESNVTAAVSAVALVPTNSQSVTASDGVGTTALDGTKTTTVFSVTNSPDTWSLANGTLVGQEKILLADAAMTQAQTVTGTFRDSAGNTSTGITLAPGAAATFFWTVSGWASGAAGGFTYN
jgi:hypothetical protein